MRNVLLLICLCVLFLGCDKEKGCTPVNPLAEEPAILAYIAVNDFNNAVRHSSGMYYEILKTGTGASPTLNSKVLVTYTGRLLNGTVFDKTAVSTSIMLTGLIEGWQIGLPLIKEGGTIKMIIPSALAYGCNGDANIPPNSVLCFEVHLIEVQ